VKDTASGPESQRAGQIIHFRSSTYWISPPTRTKLRRARPLSPIRGFMLRRLGELCRLAAFRCDHRVPLGDRSAWAFAAAEVCLYLRHGCDLLTFRQVADVPVTEREALAAIHRVCKIAERKGGAYRPTSAAALGKKLKVTAEERWACDIRTMRAVDESPAEARAELRERDRERKRETRLHTSEAERTKERERGQRRRAAKGARPHAQSLSQTRPWEAEGISRRTWDRRRKRGAETSAPARVQISSVRLFLSYSRRRTDEIASSPPAARVAYGKRTETRSALPHKLCARKQGNAARQASIPQQQSTPAEQARAVIAQENTTPVQLAALIRAEQPNISNRKIAKALGVGRRTVDRDSGPNVPLGGGKAKENNDGGGPNGPRFSGAAAARIAQRASTVFRVTSHLAAEAHRVRPRADAVPLTLVGTGHLVAEAHRRWNGALVNGGRQP
jgi:hypothetical protein